MTFHNSILSVLSPVTGGILGGPSPDPTGAAPVFGAAGPTGVPGLIAGPSGPGSAVGPVFNTVASVTSLLLSLPAAILTPALAAIGLGDGISDEDFAAETTTISLAPPNLEGFSRGNGRTANRTVVETLDILTGIIIRRRFMPGTPHMMNSDIRAAKKVFRQSAALRKTLPTRKTKESEATRMKNELVAAALQNAKCPPKCP